MDKKVSFRNVGYLAFMLTPARKARDKVAALFYFAVTYLQVDASYQKTQTMKRKIFLTAILAGCFAVCLAVADGLAGKWKASIKDDEGNSVPLHLVFNVSGEKLSGTAQAEGDPLDINDGKIAGDDFTFNVKDPDGNVITCDGKCIAAGDSISFNFTQNSMKHHVTFVRDGQ